MKKSIPFLILLVGTPALSQRAAVVRGIGTQTCKAFVTATQGDKAFEGQVNQWILGTMTDYFRRANDDPSRTLSDDLIVRSVSEICIKNADKTIDEAVSIAISSIPETEVKQP